ncbi:MAG: presqualene diphosphate synthase HpnD [Rhodospirillales bacterium]|nr:presqualene diphosphate synthase HpnD [Rhodospirillales bacterium]
MSTEVVTTPPPLTDPPTDPNSHVTGIVKRSGSSFFWAMRLLPLEKRNALFAVYAFCREVDDIADEPGAMEAKRAELSAWRDEIDRVYAGTPQFPVGHALANAVPKYNLDKEDFLAVIEGMEMDAPLRLRITDMTGLVYYCDRVACAVGRLCNRVFGIDRENGNKIAEALGLALQLTNILRDVQEDAARDHVYLPGDLLNKHGVDSSDAVSIVTQPGLEAVCTEIAALAGQKFAEARRHLAACDRRKMRPAIVMMEVYRRVYDRLEARGWGRVTEPVSVPKLEKLWIALRHGLSS